MVVTQMKMKPAQQQIDCTWMGKWKLDTEYKKSDYEDSA